MMPSGKYHHKVRSWTVLLLAGLFEVGYALSVAGSDGFTVLPWSVSTIVFFLLTLLALSVALRAIDVGIGYAVWSGIGAAGAVLLGPVLFDEALTWTKLFWLAIIIGGVVWLKLADGQRRTRHEHRTHRRQAGSPCESAPSSIHQP